MEVVRVPSAPIPGQKAGTSGLRKANAVFSQPMYTENFATAIFTTLSPSVVVLGGDGRELSDAVRSKIMRVGAALGVSRFIVGVNGIMSTPATCHAVKKREADCAVLLTASHNPAGEFGIKVNLGPEGGPAPESVMTEIYRRTTEIREVALARELPAFDLKTPGVQPLFPGCVVEVIDSVAEYTALMQTLFDFEKLKVLMTRKDFGFVFDAMHAVTGPYARSIFEDALGAQKGSVINGVPKPDFGGGHPDPNLVHAKALVDMVNDPARKITLAAASDGDGDRAMLLGHKCFVTPSDSLAVIAAHHALIPFFAQNDFSGVARSMPTSQAVDLVARKLGVPCFETPTGWKFFGNLFESSQISLCGEESFGLGSAHLREKDGIFAVLCWLSVLAHKNRPLAVGSPNVSTPLTLLRAHWNEYGRNYFQRHDYEDIDTADAANLTKHLAGLVRESQAGMGLLGQRFMGNGGEANGFFQLESVDDFAYHDPVDGSVTEHQGYRFVFTDDSRIVVRSSGTSVSGVTIRVYLERYIEPAALQLDLSVDDALRPLRDIAQNLLRLSEFLNRPNPSLIT